MITSNVTIRPYRGSDIDALYAAARESIAEISPWMWWLDESYTLAQARAWVESREAAWQSDQSYDFVVETESGRLLGTVGLNAIDPITRRANFGYWIRTSAAGQGVATRAGRQLIELTFSPSPPFSVKLHRLEIVVAVGNVKSQRVAQKLGAVCEGVLRDRLWPAGDPQDAIIYSVLKSDRR